MLWIHSHMGIRGNDLADPEAKNSAGRPQECIPIPYRDGIPNINSRMYELWEERRDFYLLKPKTGYWTKDTRKRTRRDEVEINRLRLGHTRHGFIFDPELQSPTTV